MKTILPAFALALALLAAPTAHAAELCADGTLATIRVSKITSTMPAFEEAVKAQADWYASHGLKDRITLAGIVVEGKDGKPATISSAEAMTFHYYPAGDKADVAHDEAWKAFVAKFRASSEIVSEHMACLPK